VAACAVVAYEEQGLTRLRALVVPRRPVDPGELRAHLRSRLTGPKCPREIVLVTDLPHTASGKLDRMAARATAPPAV
jgi:acyl-coenzyme A synthetase/AMP-(fatty) acid ligase